MVVDTNTLAEMNRTEVYLIRDGGGVRFFRNMLPEIAIAVSQPSGKFFHLEDFEMAYLSHGSCPYSREKNIGDYGSV